MTCEQSLFDRVISQQLITTLFQPIYDISTGEVLGYEALSRGPQGTKLASPEYLFALAAELNRVSELDLLCRKQAIINFSKQQSKAKLLLNVNPNVLLDPQHPKGETLQLLERFGMTAQDVIIEVTEQEKVQDLALFKQTITHYRELGFTIAIDDFGAGYSGLKQWSELEPEIVKIDKYFISQCNTSPVKKIFLTSILELAKITGTKVIAEGVETVAEYELLHTLGVTLMQGYYFAKPAALIEPPSYIATAS